MNLDALKAWARKHRWPLLGAGGAGAVALALYQRSHRGTAQAAPAAGDAAGPVNVSASPYPSYYSGGSTGGYGYDSSANDVYNSLQPIFEGLGREVDALSDQVGALSSLSPTTGTPANPSPGGSVSGSLPPSTPSTPSTPATPKPKPTVLEVFRKSGTAATYELLSDGTKRWITQAKYVAAGKPKVEVVSANDPRLKAPLVGAAPPEWSLTGLTNPAYAKGK